MKRLEPLSILKDSRRSLTNLFSDNIKDVNYYEARKGTTLGSHYHKTTKEYFYILKGACLFHANNDTQFAAKGALFVVCPGTMHTLECVTDISFMTFLTEPFNNDRPDLHK